MSGILVVVETRGGRPTQGSLALLAKGRELVAAGSPGDVAAIVVGPDASGIGAALGAAGADRVFVADTAVLDPGVGQAQAPVVGGVVRANDPDLVLLENSGFATDLVASLAVDLGLGVAWDLQDVRHTPDGPVGTRLALNDAVSVEVGWVGRPALAVFRLGQLEAAPGSIEVQAELVPVAVAGPPPAVARIVERIDARVEGADIRTADVIVSGGRGLRDRESLALLDDLAAAVGGVVGVSMPLVDRGWMPHSRQVGQTGNKVRPRLYVACGISGQLAHRVGMEKSKVIVAINTDATAPIFGICDLGLVGDLHTVVPELARRIREARGT